MKAMILAGGLGTRLSPLTDNKPKALVPFKGVPLLERVVRNIAAAGINHIIVNVHHFAEQVIEFMDHLHIDGVELSVSDETRQLMDTGGALLHAREFFEGDEDFLVHNVDVVTNLDISALIKAHTGKEEHSTGNKTNREPAPGNEKALVTMAVKKRTTSRSLLFDKAGCLCGWRHNETGEERFVREPQGILEDYGNSCVQVISSRLLSFFPNTKPLNLTNMYLELAGDHSIRPFIHDDDYWYDLGRYQNYLNADKEVF
jgi:NDP-sugar pyrophosphorylase family protein